MGEGIVARNLDPKKMTRVQRVMADLCANCGRSVDMPTDHRSPANSTGDYPVYICEELPEPPR